MAFVKDYNARTANQVGTVLPAQITIYEDRSFIFVIRTPPASELLKKAAGVEKGSGEAGKNLVGKVPRSAVVKIAQTKLPDLNTPNLEAAIKIVEGTARSMGIQVVEG